MANQKISNLKLGMLVLSGLFLFIMTLYIIGKNENFFGSNFEIKTRFTNVNGLMPGNNIRFAGIQAGTVKRIRIIDDTTIEVTLSIDNAMKPYIHKNAIATLGTEGLMGNKVINILPEKSPAGAKPAPLAQPGDLLATPKAVSTDEMLQTLAITNNNIAEISEDLKTTIRRINKSTALWTTLNDDGLARNIRSSLNNLSQASTHANNMTRDLHTIISDMKTGKGSIGTLLRDSSLASSLGQAIEKINIAGSNIARLTADLSATVRDIHQDITDGKGTINALLKDPALVAKLNASMENIRLGTDAFNQDMEALKHNFLLRGYFRKQAKQQAKEQQKITGKN
jgi:phospholipid/cholesterol/gamma-HCH transport system substrate-binding protein